MKPLDHRRLREKIPLSSWTMRWRTAPEALSAEAFAEHDLLCHHVKVDFIGSFYRIFAKLSTEQSWMLIFA
ncbi:hypothetical protein [Symbiopectobacterium purcellii]|uniref:hypothetical protein n=1 Tax=Symbiopectobacterium purcellii TaxID=2871826 RepID=UPI003F8680CC